MLNVYIVSAAVAGVLILLTLMGIGHDHDASVEHELGHDAGHDSASGHDGIIDWLPFLSLRFYTYFFAGFGTTGLLLTFFGDAPAYLVPWFSAGVGLFAGLGVWLLVRMLRRTELSSGATEKDLLGKQAEVLVAIRGSTPGRIRCSVRGDIIDYLAVSEDSAPIEVGDSVIVVAIEGGRAQVVPQSSIFSDDKLEQRTL